MLMFETFQGLLYNQFGKLGGSQISSQVFGGISRLDTVEGCTFEGFTELPFTQFLKQECKSDKIAVGFARFLPRYQEPCRLQGRTSPVECFIKGVISAASFR